MMTLTGELQWFSAQKMMIAIGDRQYAVDPGEIPRDVYLGVQPTGVWTEGEILLARSLETALGIQFPAGQHARCAARGARGIAE
jgi:hypothetical protein